MAATREIPFQNSTDLPALRIVVNGTELPTTVSVVSVTVSKSVNKISAAQLVINDGNMATEEYELSSGSDFVPGSEVEIYAGYHGLDSLIFKGIIIKHGINFKAGKQSELYLELRDACIKATVGRKNRYFEESTDSDIIEEILGDYSDLTPDVESTDLEHQEMVQYNSTDWDMVLSRADVNGKFVFVDDGNITIKAPDFSPDSLFILAQGDNVFEFEAEIDARNQYPGTKSKSWDSANQEVVELEGADPGITEQGNLTSSELSDVVGIDSFDMQHSGQLLNEELQSWADAKLLKSMMAKIRGRVMIQGFSDIKPGDIIELESFGDRFNGKAFVSGITHTINASSIWYTNIYFGISEKWFSEQYDDIVESHASGLVPAINGLHYGIVTNIHEDPDGEARVKVKIPIISSDEEGVWARVSTLDAGSERGTFFRPEVDDEVLVGFINDDPREPVILGMLHSSAMASPVEPDEENNEKGIVSREGIKLMFDDDKVILTLETPNGNKITLNDDDGGITIEDENGNKAEFTSDGINLESAGDINIKASSGDVNIEGLNVNAKASTQFKAEGSSGAEMSSSGQAVLKGSLVSIN